MRCVPYCSFSSAVNRSAQTIWLTIVYLKGERAAFNAAYSRIYSLPVRLDHSLQSSDGGKKRTKISSRENDRLSVSERKNPLGTLIESPEIVGSSLSRDTLARARNAAWVINPRRCCPSMGISPQQPGQPVALALCNTTQHCEADKKRLEELKNERGYTV